MQLYSSEKIKKVYLLSLSMLSEYFRKCIMISGQLPVTYSQEFGWWLIVISFLVFKVDWRSPRNTSFSVSSPVSFLHCKQPSFCTFFCSLFIKFVGQAREQNTTAFILGKGLINFYQWIDAPASIHPAASRSPFSFGKLTVTTDIFISCKS